MAGFTDLCYFLGFDKKEIPTVAIPKNLQCGCATINWEVSNVYPQLKQRGYTLLRTHDWDNGIRVIVCWKHGREVNFIYGY